MEKAGLQFPSNFSADAGPLDNQDRRMRDTE